MYEVGIPPPHNSDKPHRLVAIINNNNNNNNNNKQTQILLLPQWRRLPNIFIVHCILPSLFLQSITMFIFNYVGVYHFFAPILDL